MDGNATDRFRTVVEPEPSAPSVQQLFNRQYVAMVRLARLLVGSQAVAEDLVQDVFVRLLQAPAADTPVAYLRTSVVNACRSWHRHRGREQRALPKLVERDDVPATGHDIDDSLARLGFRQRAVLVLRFYDDLPDDEIARVLGCQRATVRSIAARALRNLRVELEEKEP